MKEIKLRYDGTLFDKVIGVEVKVGKVYRALKSNNQGCYFIYDEHSIDTRGCCRDLIPHENCWFMNRKESMHFTVVE